MYIIPVMCSYSNSLKIKINLKIHVCALRIKKKCICVTSVSCIIYSYLFHVTFSIETKIMTFKNDVIMLKNPCLKVTFILKKLYRVYAIFHDRAGQYLNLHKSAIKITLLTLFLLFKIIVLCLLRPLVFFGFLNYVLPDHKT